MNIFLFAKSFLLLQRYILGFLFIFSFFLNQRRHSPLRRLKKCFQKCCWGFQGNSQTFLRTCANLKRIGVLYSITIWHNMTIVPFSSSKVTPPYCSVYIYVLYIQHVKKRHKVAFKTPPGGTNVPVWGAFNLKQESTAVWYNFKIFYYKTTHKERCIV